MLPWRHRGPFGVRVGILLTALCLIPFSQAQSQTSATQAETLRKQVEAAARKERTLREESTQKEENERVQRESAINETREEERLQRDEKAAPIERALSEQQALQESLLRQNTGRSESGSTSPVGSTLHETPTAANPRVAGRAPVDRVLPEEIFDQSKEEIPKGTWGNSEPLRVIRLVLDADGDGKPELIRFLDRSDEQLMRQEADRNYDGILDSWSQYEGGELVTRVLDENDDGNPEVFETYRDGRVSLRELDRDDDGVRDVFYRYRGKSLIEERHDANNDGIIDLIIVYEERLRVRAEEDTDRDGRMDLWTRYTNGVNKEQVSQIERDVQGGGFADTFELFESQNGRSMLVRREQDLNGDGEIDVVSFYVNGKLVRRQIRDSDLTPLS